MRLGPPRRIAWAGGIFVAVIAALAAYDIFEGYQATVASTGRELETQGRIIAEQTARSVQAVDVLLRHLAEQSRQGSLAAMSDRELHQYLRGQAIGLVQIDGLTVIAPSGLPRAISLGFPLPPPAPGVADLPIFRTHRDEPNAGLLVGGALQSEVDREWVFPIGRRLETPNGQFAGVALARGKVEYFQRFYRNLQLGPGTTVTLMHQDGTLIARHPEASAALGKRFPLLDAMLARAGTTRAGSPVDGVERFGTAKLVPDHPLAVIVARDADVALAPWRAQARGTVLRTLALSALAGALLWLLARQLSRLRASEERFALAVAGSNDGIWDFDFVTRRHFNSARARELVGLPAGPEVEPLDEWLAKLPQHLHPEDVARRQAAMEAHLAGRTPLYEVELRHRHRDGAYRWVRIRGICVRDAEGRPLRMAGSVSDIDAYKEAEAARARLEGQLLQAKKLEAIGTLAGGIAHDFNNILAAILGYGEMAQKSAPAGTALRRHLDAVVGAGMRAKSLVERILAFSRSGIGERVPVHVQSVVAEALDLAAASLPAHVRMARRLEAGDAAVMGDPTQIHQVVMNLCANAAQAMKSAGTLSVALDVVDKTRSIAATSALAPGRYVRLAVRDTGSGIAPEVLERIFDPFFTTKGVGVGTGLGLSMVHGIVTDLGGGIDVESRRGEGATFTVYLPSSAAAAALARPEEAPPLGAGEAVLLVDDEETLVRLSEEMLAELGYEPVGFTSAPAALEAFRAAPGRFAAVLSDESMPGMTGSELAREIRAVAPGVPIVLMSGVVGAGLAARARELGVAEVLAKPLVARDIARSLAGALAPRRRPREGCP